MTPDRADAGGGALDQESLRVLAGPLLARCTLPAAGHPAVCAWSGGPDSTALVLLAVAAGCEVSAIHVDHGLRPGSADDSVAIDALAALIGVPVTHRRVRVEPGGDLEERAREARRGVLPPGTLTGHTADDQAETVLLALLRGAGPWGLAGMRTDGHPLLALRRSETERLCADLGLRPLRDPTNSDPAHRRNRVRHELLPLLGDIGDRDPVPLLCRAAGIQRAIADDLDAVTAALDPTDAPSVGALAPTLAAAVLRRWFRSETGSVHPPDRATLQRMMAVARGDTPRTDLLAGWRLARTGQRLRIEPIPATRGRPEGDPAVASARHPPTA